MKMLAGVALTCAVCVACATAPADFYELTPPDPDCHFFNCGAELNIVTEALPEPGTMMLLLVGAGLSLLRYHRRRAAL